MVTTSTERAREAVATPFSPCLLCGGERTSLLRGPPEIARCSGCGTLSLARFPEPSERESLYQEGYHREASGGRFLGLLEVLVRGFRGLRARSLERRGVRPRSILDVGCGRGVLLEILQRRGWRVVGTQLSQTAARAARERGVGVICGELPDIELEPDSFGVITYYHVLEHVARPDLYLEKSHRLLADGGLLLVEVPDLSSPGFRLLGPRHFCVDYPNHLYFFSPRTLQELLERHGFEVEEVRRFSLEYSPFTTLQNLLNCGPGRPNRLYRALMSTPEARRLRRSPLTWLHAGLALVLAGPALLISLSGLLFPVGNTVRFVCRKGRRCPSRASRQPAGPEWRRRPSTS